MTRYYVISPLDSLEEVALLSAQFNRRFVRLERDGRLYFLDGKISEEQVDEFFEVYPGKRGRSLVFSRITDLSAVDNKGLI